MVNAVLATCKEAQAWSVTMKSGAPQPRHPNGTAERVCMAASSRPLGRPSSRPEPPALLGQPGRPFETSPALRLGRTRIGAGVTVGGSQNVT